MNDMFERTRLLIGCEGLNKIKQATVLVIGVGGVGSICVESLARSGVGKIIVVDGDTIDITNLNRQLQTTENNIGKSKAHEMVKHIKSISNNIDIEYYDIFFDKDHFEIFEKVDFVVDAIDTLSSKLDLIEICLEKKIPFISSMGMGNRLDPSLVHQTTLDKTEYDPLAKVLRKMARDKKIDLKKINVIFSNERPITQNKVLNKDGETRKERIPPASMFLVPPAAGLLAASICIRYLIQADKKASNKS